MTVIVGMSDKHSVMVDLDNTSFKRVKSLAFLTTKRFLGLKVSLFCSPKHYHVVFDKHMRYWSSVLKVIAWMGIVGNNRNLWKWMCMQTIKGYCTLRVALNPLIQMALSPAQGFFIVTEATTWLRNIWLLENVF